MDKVKTIPELRFNEFSECWQETIIGDLGEILGGGTPSTTKTDFWKGTIPWVSSSDLGDENIRYIRKSRFISKEAIKQSATKLIPAKSILIVSRVGVGKVAINETPICTSQDFQSLVPSKDNHVFLAYLIQLKTKQLIEFNQGTSIKGFVKSELANFKLKIPTLPEQQKIAAFLTAVDDKIRQLSKKKALLEQYKKGVMQQIFSREIRFKNEGGNEYQDWEEKKLGDVVDFISTNSFSRSLLNYDEGFVRNIHYGDIHTKFKTQFRTELEKVPFINNDVNISSITEASYCREGDLIIADASEDYKDVGKAIEVISTGNEKLLAGLHTYIARDKEDCKTALGFKGYLMQNTSVRKQIMTMAVGISVLGISKVNLGKVNIHLPCLDEQTKIANFLSAIDDKIKGVTLEIEHTRQFKKGLLQQMFV